MALSLWIRPYLDDAGLKRIEAAVHGAEKRTRGEIVPVVARQSAPYGHVAWLAAAALLALAYAGGLELWRAKMPWGHWAWLPLDLFTSAVSGWLLAKLPYVRRLLTPDRDLEANVHRAAEAAFLELGVHRTDDRSGILLYVSLTEHRAVVLADEGISTKVDAKEWDDVCKLLLDGAARRDLATGFERAVDHSSSVLQRFFPLRKGKAPKRDQLADRLRMLA
jgi:putative membrane protein